MEKTFKILVVDDEPDLRAISVRLLRGAGYLVYEAASGSEGLAVIRDVRPDLVLLDVVMPGRSGVEICREIKANPETSDIFVILISSLKISSDQQSTGLESGSDGYIVRPIEKRELLARVESSIRIGKIQNALKESEERYRLLFKEMINGFALHEIIYDDAGKACDYRFLDVNPAFEMLTGLKKEHMIGKAVSEVLPEIEPFWIEHFSRVISEGQPVHFEGYSRPLSKHFEVAAFKTKGDQFGVTFMDITERKQVEKMMEFMAFHDNLTGLPNRRLFMDRLDQALKEARRTNELIALLYIDLDGFKAVNDHFGHEAGDEILQEAARRIQAAIRESDTAARLGGDEFAAILRHMNNLEGAQRAAGMIHGVLGEPFETKGGKTQLGASIGISLYPDDGGDLQDLIKTADANMYLEKKNKNKPTYDKT